MNPRAETLQAYVAGFHGDLPEPAQQALVVLVSATLDRDQHGAGSEPVQAALEGYLDSAGGQALKAEPARSYVRHFLESPHVIAARYFYSHAKKALSREDADLLKTLVADRFDLEAWRYQADR